MPLALKSNPGARKSPRSQDPDEFRAPLHEHLDELRSRFFRSFGAITLGWMAGWRLMPPFVNAILNQSFRDIHPRPTIVWTNITEPFLNQLKVSFYIGLGIALPYIVIQIWGFVAPGLKESEKRPIKTVLPISIVLFFIGAGFCWMILPQAYAWFASFLGQFPMTQLLQNQNDLVVFSIKMMLAFGICFQLPLVVYVLGRIGILSPDTLIQYWRQATVFIFFISAAITPSNDPISMLMMAIPLCILFAVSVFAVKWTTKPKNVLYLEDMPPLD